MSHCDIACDVINGMTVLCLCICASGLFAMQKGLKPGSKAARSLANVNHGNSMAAAHAAGQAATEPPKPPSPPETKKPPARRKEYMPRKGTANYTFLICMFRGLKLGKQHYGKEELMQLAEGSGLADKPIHGGNAAASVHAGNVHEAYNGWSCFTVCDCLLLVCKLQVPLLVRPLLCACKS